MEVTQGAISKLETPNTCAARRCAVAREGIGIGSAGLPSGSVDPCVALDWDAIDHLEDAYEVAGYLGRAAGKIHCVADAESGETLVTVCADQAVGAAIAGRDAFVSEMVGFAQSYSCQVRDDHRLSVDLFRNNRLLGL